MRLLSRDGASVTLWPTGYEFGSGSAARDAWDANWLLVRGEVRTAGGATWTFHEPCLTTWDAARVLRWLRATGSGAVAPITITAVAELADAAGPQTDARGEDFVGLLGFVEPNLGFSVASLDDEDVVLRVHLSLESAPPLPDEHAVTEDAELGDLYAYHIAISMTRRELLAAADEWQRDIAPYPER